MITIINTLLQFIAAIATLILVHELGHFVAAKLVNVEVEEFGIGFPPRLMKLFEAGGTIFSLNWIPLGGFVRPKGENDPDVKGGLAAASPWARIFVLFSGPLINLLAGVVIFTVVFLRLGDPITDQVKILQVAENSPAQRAGLRADDLIMRVNEVEIDSMQTLSEEISAHVGKTVEITYLRDGRTDTVSLVPRDDPPPDEGAIGILMGNPSTPIAVPRAVSLGFSTVYRQSVLLLSLPVQIINGTISPEQARPIGYKGMFDIYSSRREADLATTGDVPGVNTLLFLASITVSLGLLNLLPIPALDGGRILFVLPELLIGRRIPPSYENVINLIGFAMLIFLLLYVNIQDFVDPVVIP